MTQLLPSMELLTASLFPLSFLFSVSTTSLPSLWAQAPGIRSINPRLKTYLNQSLTWCDRWRIKLNPGKTHLINFSQRKVCKGTTITMYSHPLKVTNSVKFLGVHTDNHMNMNQYVEHIERASLISRMRIARLNSINSLLIRQYKTFTRPYMDYACTALTVLNKTQRQKLEVIQNRSLRYARRTIDSICITNNALLSYCNIVSVEQRILALAHSGWSKVSKTNNDIINFTYHHQSNSNTNPPLNIIKGNRFF